MISASTNFTVFPYKIGSVILLGLIILLVLIYRARRRIGLALKVLFGKHK